MKQTFQSLRSKGENKVWTFFVLLLASAAFALIPMWLACVIDRNVMFLSYFQTPLIALLNILPIVLFALVLYVLINRAWIAGLLAGLLCIIAGFVNYYKITFRNEPLNFEDITLLREGLDMTGKGYTLFLNKSMVLCLLLVLFGVLFLFFFAGGRQGKKTRLITGAALLLLIYPLVKLYTNYNVYTNLCRNEQYINQWSETQVYYSKGMVYPFLYSIGQAGDTKPEGYDEDAVVALLEEYSDAAIPEDKKVDVISIMLEAYADLEHFGIEGLQEEVYAPLREIQEMSIHGNLVTNIFAGGTVNTERAFLTGYSQMGSFRGNSNAYPWYFRENGYYTEGYHPCYEWFYNRQNINENLGFENYYYVENYYGDITYDDVFFPDLEEQYRAYCEENDTPYFSYNLTYQGHGPYDSETTWFGDDHVVGGNYSQETRNVLNNYFGSVQNTMENMLLMLKNLQDYERPLVVVFFGDHMPWMGDANSIYHELGFNFDLSSSEGFLNYYSTPYVIWANDAAKEVLGNDFIGESEQIAPCFLMSKLFALCGWEGPAYMQVIEPVMAEVPVPTDKGRYFLADGSMTSIKPERVTMFESIQYYYRNHFKYQHLLQ